MAKTNPGKILEEDMKASAKDQNIFFYRVKDVPPTLLKPNARVSKNDFDSFIYRKPNLFPIEFKSTQNRSISFDEKIIKNHQIEALKEAVEFDGLIAGFIFNFREYDNATYFVHINDFLTYKQIAESESVLHNYKSKVNKSSIPLDICKEIGVPLISIKKKVRYRYYINKLLDELIEKFNSK